MRPIIGLRGNIWWWGSGLLSLTRFKGLRARIVVVDGFYNGRTFAKIESKGKLPASFEVCINAVYDRACYLIKNTILLNEAIMEVTKVQLIERKN